MTSRGSRLVVGGIDLFAELGLILTNETTLNPPPLKRYTVDVPGGNGVIDLTESLSGEAVYNNRENTFVLRANVASQEQFEAVKTAVSNLLHGRKLPYRLTADPEYTYTGRFEVDEYYSKLHSACIKLNVSADPYKHKETCTYRVNAAGGIVITLESGRKPVCPTWEFASETIVSAGDISVQMQPGLYKVNDLWLHEGVNEVYVNSYLGEGNVAAERYADDPVGSHAGRRVSDLIWEGVRGAAAEVSDWLLDTVVMHSAERIVDAEFSVNAESDEYAVYIRYDWKDL